MSLERSGPSVHLRLKLRCQLPCCPPPAAQRGERLFVDRMEHLELLLHDLQDVHNIVEAKLAVLGLRDHTYSVLHGDAAGDKVVVDDTYWSMLVSDLLRSSTAGAPSGGVSPSCNAEADVVEVNVEFIVEIGEALPPALPSGASDALGGGGGGGGGLTSASLAALRQQHKSGVDVNQKDNGALALGSGSSGGLQRSEETLLRIGDVLDQPPFPNFVVVAVLCEMRAKRSQNIIELELCDRDSPQHRMTAVCFDAATSETLRRTLRGNSTEVVEMRNILVIKKTPKDIQYQTNQHPMMLRLSGRSQLRVVENLPPGTLQKRIADENRLTSSGTSTATSPPLVVEHNARPAIGAIGASPTVSSMANRHAARISGRTEALSALPSRAPIVPLKSTTNSANPLSLATTSSTILPAHVMLVHSSVPPTASCGLSSSSSVSSGGSCSSHQKTLFRFSASSTSSSSSASSSCGIPFDHRSGVSGSSASTSGGVLPYAEPGVPSVGNLHDRDLALERSESHLEVKKQNINRKKGCKPSTQCILCDFDADRPTASMDVVKTMLTQSTANRGRRIPDFGEIMSALSDRRSLYSSNSATPPRYYCKARVIDVLSGTIHLVHPRCAHLCALYQSGRSTLDDVAMLKSTHYCTLCGIPGATVRCYHPECNEEYHVMCALFSCGYVNFGIRDPHKPVPACPRHTQVKCPSLLLHIGAEEDERNNAAGCGKKKRGRDEGDERNIAFDSSVVEVGELRDPDHEEDS